MRFFSAVLFALVLAMVSVEAAAESGRPVASPVPALTMMAVGRLLPAVSLPDNVLDVASLPVLEKVAVGLARSRIIQTACLALAVYHEARGEPAFAQRAVAATILNRMRSAAYPRTLCGVVYDGASRPFKCQFSFACDRRSDVPRNRSAVEASVGIAFEAEASERERFASCFELATHYHRYDVHPVWSRKLNLLGRMGDHLFFASDRVVRRMANADARRSEVSQCNRLAIFPSLSL